jgi:hypothetical protein
MGSAIAPGNQRAITGLRCQELMCPHPCTNDLRAKKDPRALAQSGTEVCIKKEEEKLRYRGDI